MDITIEHMPHVPIELQALECVERKGLGHPDSICDAVMERVSVALNREYLKVAGRVLHHNIDKGLLVAGQTEPALGGGRVIAPIRLIFGDRATTLWQGQTIAVREIAEAAAGEWLRKNLRFVDPGQHVVFQNELRPGSAELVDIFQRERPTANDTSAAVGYAPLSETERIVLAAERELNSSEFKRRFPEAGEDVKIMGIRRGRNLHLTVALAMVDRFVLSEQAYSERKTEIAGSLSEFLSGQLQQLDSVTVELNKLDVPGRGLGGMYLTVLGTSAECGDGGQVGRGNRVNGLISLNRLMGTEAAAGKNAVSHVGKIYNVLARQMAERVHAEIEGIQEVNVWLCSQIGRALDDPWLLSAQLILASGARLADVEPKVRETLNRELHELPEFVKRLIRGEIPIC